MTIKKFIGLGLLGGLIAVSPVFTACTTADEGTRVAIPPEPANDPDYARVLARWHKDASIFDRFQNRLSVHAVLFTEEMRQAYLNRWVQIRGDSSAKIGMDVGGKLAVFVSVFTPEEEFLRLDDSSLWTVRLMYGEKQLAPFMIRRIYDKPLHAGFFEFVNNWTYEYLIVFDVSVTDSSDAVVLPSVVSAQLMSSLASVEFQWK